MISNEARQSYLESDGCHCPYCNSDNIDSGLVHLGRDRYETTVSCNDCDKSWKDIYDIVDVEEIRR
jgi:transposase-like protein